VLGLKRGAFLLGHYAAMTSSAIRPSLARRISAALMHRQASVWDLPGQDGTFRQDVVGESFHAGQFALLLKGVHVDSNGVDLFEKASLVPERRNRFDPLSVAVVIRGQRVGHLPRDDAARLQPTLLAATKAGRDPQVDAMIYARADGERSGKTWHRVRLDLAPLKSSPQREGDARPPAPAADAASGGGRTRHGWPRPAGTCQRDDQARRLRPCHGWHAARSGRQVRLSALQGRDLNPDAKIKTTDLEAALDYLEGLSFIVRSFDESSRGREGRDILLEGLQAMDSGAMSWKPLRHQAAAGQGWAVIADHVDELRRRLLEGFADAAL
jgi:hypothetical protein